MELGHAGTRSLQHPVRCKRHPVVGSVVSVARASGRLVALFCQRRLLYSPLLLPSCRGASAGRRIGDHIAARFTPAGRFWSLLAAGSFRSTEEEMESRRVTRFRIAAGIVMLLGMLTKECPWSPGAHSDDGNWWCSAHLEVRPPPHTAAAAQPACHPDPHPHGICRAEWRLPDLGFRLNIEFRDEPVSPYLITQQFTVVAYYLRLMVWPAGRDNIDPTLKSGTPFFEGQVMAFHASRHRGRRVLWLSHDAPWMPVPGWCWPVLLVFAEASPSPRLAAAGYGGRAPPYVPLIGMFGVCLALRCSARPLRQPPS